MTLQGVLGWLFFTFVIGAIAAASESLTGKKRSPVSWGVLAFFISPLLAGVILLILMAIDYRDKPIGRFQERPLQASKLLATSSAVIASQNTIANFSSGSECEECGMQAPKGQKFCGNCGGKISETKTHFCTQCGAEFTASDKFCGSCGSPNKYQFTKRAKQ